MPTPTPNSLHPSTPLSYKPHALKPSTAPTASSTPTFAAPHPSASPPPEPLPGLDLGVESGGGGEAKSAGTVLTESEGVSVGTISGTAGAEA